MDLTSELNGIRIIVEKRTPFFSNQASIGRLPIVVHKSADKSSHLVRCLREIIENQEQKVIVLHLPYHQERAIIMVLKIQCFYGMGRG